jgi:uncharacterized protein YbaA (DUF1428 family)
MTYVQGFVLPVETGNKQAYLDLATQCVPIFSDYGALRLVECWGDDVPDGNVTDMKRAVEAKPGETIVFSWIIWPDRETCEAAHGKMMSDERMSPQDPMPFDAARMIVAGFEQVYDTGRKDGASCGYIDGMAAPIPLTNKATYADHSRQTSQFFLDQGATRVVDGWADDIPDGKVTDFKRAVAAQTGEAVIFSWIEWPDKATRDAGMQAMMQDEAMAAIPMPFDGKRLIMGGFQPILDTEMDARDGQS